MMLKNTLLALRSIETSYWVTCEHRESDKLTAMNQLRLLVQEIQSQQHFQSEEMKKIVRVHVLEGARHIHLEFMGTASKRFANNAKVPLAVGSSNVELPNHSPDLVFTPIMRRSIETLIRPHLPIANPRSSLSVDLDGIVPWSPNPSKHQLLHFIAMVRRGIQGSTHSSHRSRHSHTVAVVPKPSLPTI